MNSATALKAPEAIQISGAVVTRVNVYACSYSTLLMKRTAKVVTTMLIMRMSTAAADPWPTLTHRREGKQTLASRPFQTAGPQL